MPDFDPDNIDISDDKFEEIFDQLPKYAKAAFYVRPRVELSNDELSEYKGMLMQIPAKHRGRNSIRNLVEQYARTVVALRLMQDTVSRDGVTTIGSQGQLQRHPLLPAIATYISAVQKITTQLHAGMSEDTRTTRRQAEKDAEDVQSMKNAQASGGLLATPTNRQVQ